MAYDWNRRFGGREPAEPVALTLEAAARAVSDGVLPVASYRDRDGYNPLFLDTPVPLPGPGVWVNDLEPLVAEALFEAGADPHELKYRHFSTVQCASRRQPLFSAVNIDGKTTVDVPRTDLWRRDSRIRLEAQIHREVYGAEQAGLFSRGHQTRREDPNWETAEFARQADADTFHVTNACPQQQQFNGGIWLELENYVLHNADDEDLKVSVVTGPVFRPTDPVYRGIQVPVEFWKIVVFKHPERGLAAIAYKRSQASVLPSARFVFGDFQDTQVSIRSLQEDTGLDFCAYLKLDVLQDADPAMTVRLNSVEDAWLN